MRFMASRSDSLTNSICVLTTLSSELPDALRIASRLSIAWWNSVSKPPSTKSPVLGSRPIWPVTQIKPPCLRAWTYGPRGIGAPLVVTVGSGFISFLLSSGRGGPQRVQGPGRSVRLLPVDVDDQLVDPRVREGGQAPGELRFVSLDPGQTDRHPRPATATDLIGRGLDHVQSVCDLPLGDQVHRRLRHPAVGDGARATESGLGHAADQDRHGPGWPRARVEVVRDAVVLALEALDLASPARTCD